MSPPRGGGIAAKRVYAPREAADGTRILVMRLWPRGIRKAHVDGWLRDLGAHLPDLRAFKGGRIAWPEMRRRYLAGLRRPEAAAALAELRALARQGPVTVLCACEDERQCHRTLLVTRLRRSP